MNKKYVIYSYDDPQGYYTNTYIFQGENFLATTREKEKAKTYSSLKRANNVLKKLKLKISPYHELKVEEVEG